MFLHDQVRNGAIEVPGELSVLSCVARGAPVPLYVCVIGVSADDTDLILQSDQSDARVNSRLA